MTDSEVNETEVTEPEENETAENASKLNETEEYLQSLLISSSFQESAMQSVIDALELPAGSRGLDVGCGFGAQVMQLAEVVGDIGHVTGVDISPEFLDHGRRMVKGSDLADRIFLVEGDMNQLPFRNNEFDWAWSASCVGYFPGDPMPALREMARVVRPGGTIALIVWSSETLLPGYPELEARLRLTTAGLAPFKKGMNPQQHFMRVMGRLCEAGLEDVHGSTFVDDIQNPMTDELRRSIIGLFEMRWPDVESELSGEDWVDLQRLILPESEDFILDRPDYYGFYTYTVFRGTVP